MPDISLTLSSSEPVHGFTRSTHFKQPLNAVGKQTNQHNELLLRRQRLQRGTQFENQNLIPTVLDEHNVSDPLKQQQQQQHAQVLTSSCCVTGGAPLVPSLDYTMKGPPCGSGGSAQLRVSAEAAASD